MSRSTSCRTPDRSISDLIGRGDNANAYRSRVLIRSTGVVEAHLTKSVAGTESSIATSTVTGLTYTANTVLHVRMQVTGSGTTSLKLKVWRDGTAEPTTWRVQGTDTTAALQVGTWSRRQGLPVRIGSQRAGDVQGGQPQGDDRRLSRATTVV